MEESDWNSEPNQPQQETIYLQICLKASYWSPKSILDMTIIPYKLFSKPKYFIRKGFNQEKDNLVKIYGQKSHSLS